MTNPLLSPSALPFGLPPFADIDDGHYAEAVDAGLNDHLAEIQAIVDNPEPATFDNTALAMEKSGRLLDRAAASSSPSFRPTPRRPSKTWRRNCRPASPRTRMPYT